MTSTNKYHIKKYHFSQGEDEKLKDLIQKYGENDWESIASEMPNRSIRQCRERWLNHLKDTVKKEKWTFEEDNLLKIKYQQIGPKWKMMEQFFPGRTAISIRNRFNCLSRYNNYYTINNIMNIPYQFPFYSVNYYQTYPKQIQMISPPNPMNISYKAQESTPENTNQKDEKTKFEDESFVDTFEDNFFDVDFCGLDCMSEF